MPSQLRYSSTPVSVKTASSFEPSPLQPPQKKQKMTLTQTYYLAHTARAKLSKEAARADHDLRLLVGHANLLDGLMLDLAEAEREQENWFHQTVRGASKASEESKHIQWADSLPEVLEDDDESWDGSDADEDEISATLSVPLRKAPSPPMTITTTEVDMTSDEDAEYDDDEEKLALTRISSRSTSRTPPELLDESDSSDSDDDSMPPSPPQAKIPLDAFTEKQRQSIVTTSFYAKSSEPRTTTITSPPSEEEAFYDDGFYLPQRQQVAAY